MENLKFNRVRNTFEAARSAFAPLNEAYKKAAVIANDPTSTLEQKVLAQRSWMAAHERYLAAMEVHIELNRAMN